MDGSTLVSMVTTVGFPIVACGACGFALKYMYDTMMRRLDEESKRHETETDRLTEAINNNTLALTVLTERFTKEV